MTIVAYTSTSKVITMKLTSPLVSSWLPLLLPCCNGRSIDITTSIIVATFLIAIYHCCFSYYYYQGFKYRWDISRDTGMGYHPIVLDMIVLPSPQYLDWHVFGHPLSQVSGRCSITAHPISWEKWDSPITWDLRPWPLWPLYVLGVIPHHH